MAVERNGAPGILSWDYLKVPDDYHQMEKGARQDFLIGGIDVLAANIDSLGLIMSGNIIQINTLVTTPIKDKETIPLEVFDEAEIGMEYAMDVFVRGWLPVDILPEDRAIVVAFLGELDDHLRSKYNSRKQSVRTRLSAYLKSLLD